MSEVADVSTPTRGAVTLASATFQAAVSALGLGTVLYAIGFVALRAHYASLGVSPGTLDSQEITEEGGRFLYHLLFIPSSAVSHLSWRSVVVLCAVPMIALLEGWTRGRIRALTGTISTRSMGLLASLGAAVLLVITAIFAETVWAALQIQNLLFATDPTVVRFRSEAARIALYGEVLWRLGLVALIAVCLGRVVWPRANVGGRVLIGIQILVAAAAIAAWPMVYGSLFMSDTRPTITNPDRSASGEDHLLLRKDGAAFLVWNKTTRRVEFWKSETVVTLGPKAHLLE